LHTAGEALNGTRSGRSNSGEYREGLAQQVKSRHIVGHRSEQIPEIERFAHVRCEREHKYTGCAGTQALRQHGVVQVWLGHGVTGLPDIHIRGCEPKPLQPRGDKRFPMFESAVALFLRDCGRAPRFEARLGFSQLTRLHTTHELSEFGVGGNRLLLLVGEFRALPSWSIFRQSEIQAESEANILANATNSTACIACLARPFALGIEPVDARKASFRFPLSTARLKPLRSGIDEPCNADRLRADAVLRWLLRLLAQRQ
jgi:hypothetical protein